MLIITAIICRVMFRFGNKPIEEGQHIVFKCGTVKPKPWTRNQERFYHWRYAVGWMGNFIFFGVGLWYMSATLTPSPTPILNRVPSPSPSPSLSPSPSPSSSPSPSPRQPEPEPEPELEPEPTRTRIRTRTQPEPGT